MRLLYLTVSLPFAAKEAFFIPEARELLRQGHEILILPRSPRGYVVNTDAAMLKRYTCRRSLFSPTVLFFGFLETMRNPAAAWRAWRPLFQSRNFLVFIKNLTVLPKGMWCSRLARRWNADHIHAQWGLTTATMAWVASRISGIGWSFTLHRGDIIDDNLLAEKVRAAQFTRVISEDGRRLSTTVCGRGGSRNLIVSHLGVDIPDIPITKISCRVRRAVLCPALLIERKGQEYLIDAVGRLRRAGMDLELKLAGEGPRRDFLANCAVQNGIKDFVHLLGYVQHAQLLRLYAKGEIDIVALPTLHEGIPVALMEAMSYGIPVVSTTAGGTGELLQDGAGLIVPARDSAALADALKRLILEKGLAEQVGRAGRRRIEEKFDVVRTTRKLVEKIVETR